MKIKEKGLTGKAIKRDSLQAELERGEWLRPPDRADTRTATLITPAVADPQLSTAKRQQRTQAFSSHMAQAALERQVAAAQTAKLELESKLREKELLIERLEGDRRLLAEQEKEAREEKERERAEYLEEKVRATAPALRDCTHIRARHAEESRQ